MDANLHKYCGLALHQAEALLSLAHGGRDIHPSVLFALRQHGLVDRRDERLTDFGGEVAARADLILTGNFVEPTCRLPGIVQYELRELFCPDDGLCSAHGLTATHLEAMKAIVLCPGQVLMALETVHGYDTLRRLEAGEFIKVGEWRRYDPVWPTAKADAFMAHLAGKLFTAQVGVVEG